MKIVTFNVNGIRAAIEKGLIPWMDENDFDVVCVQETKAHQGSVPVLLLEDAGFHHCWHSAKRKGYSGVATFSRQAPDQVIKGMGVTRFDDEGRIIRIDIGDLSILNGYFPNGSSGPRRHAFKLSFLREFHSWILELRRQRPHLLVVGDFNIAHRELDVFNPRHSRFCSGFTLEERHWMTQWFASGFVDAFRHLHADEVSHTWWPTASSGRQLDRGWRLDYQSVSDQIAARIVAVEHMHDVYLSDHCPVLLEIDLD